jgi:hypothetical protein
MESILASNEDCDHGLFTMKLKLLPLAITAALLTTVHGATISYSLDTIMIGTQAPAPPPPYATMTVEDTGVNSITLTVTSSLAGPGEFWTKLGFNLKDDHVFDGSATVGSFSTSGVFTLPTVLYGENVGSGGGGLNYDIWFSFATAPPGDRFDGNDSFSIVVNGVSTSDFLSSPVDRQVIMHGQGLVDGQSAWVGTSVGAGQVPEPSAALLGGLGLFALLRRNRSRK